MTAVLRCSVIIALASKIFPTLLSFYAIGARIATEIKNWYSSQVFTIPTSMFDPACRFGSLEKIS